MRDEGGPAKKISTLKSVFVQEIVGEKNEIVSLCVIIDYWFMCCLVIDWPPLFLIGNDSLRLQVPLSIFYGSEHTDS